jgi:hypothetical protein
MHKVNFTRLDLPRNRIIVRAAGLWDVREAVSLVRSVETLARSASVSRNPFEYLADLDGLVLHTREVAEVVSHAADVIGGLSLGRIACNFGRGAEARSARVLAAFGGTHFLDRNEALAWLGWSRNYIADLRMEPLAAAA